LDSALKTDYPSFEVLFVDNASTDGSVEHVKTNFAQNSQLRIIQNEKNLGFTEGNNRGIKHAKGKYIILLNTDVRVTPNWLTELVKAAQPPEVGAAQSRLLNMDKPEVLDCAGGLLDYYGYQFERGRGEKPTSENEGGEIFYAKGASMLLKRQVLEKTGLFDPAMFLYFDEVDLCWRIWLSGYKVVYAPASTVYHASGSTASKLQVQTRLYFYTRNHIRILLKNYNLANACKAVKISMLFETRNIALALVRRKPFLAVSIMKGLLWNIANLKSAMVQRQVMQRHVRKVPDEKIRKQMLQPYPPLPLYFIYGRSKYRSKQQTEP
jgi:GT2 family glycosyltransferase